MGNNSYVFSNSQYSAENNFNYLHDEPYSLEDLTVNDLDNSFYSLQPDES